MSWPAVFFVIPVLHMEITATFSILRFWEEKVANI